MAEQGITSAQVIDEFQSALDSAKDAQNFERVKRDLKEQAKLMREAGLSAELTKAIEDGPEAVDKVLKRFNRRIMNRNRKVN